MFSPQSSQRIMCVSAGLSAFAVYKHTSIAFNELFPRLDRGLSLEAEAVFAAKSNFLQVGAAWVIIGILQLKWAKYGLVSGYDREILAFYTAYFFVFGLGSYMKGVYIPLVPLWGIPALTALSQL